MASTLNNCGSSTNNNSNMGLQNINSNPSSSTSSSTSSSSNPLSHYRIVSTFKTHLVLEDTTTNSKALYKEYPIYLDK